MAGKEFLAYLTSHVTLCPLSGNADVRKRAPAADAKGNWDSATLFDVDDREMSLSCDIEEGGCTLSLIASHMEISGPEEAYHCTMGVQLDREDIKLLRDFLTYVLGTP
jgi:hypothetical protein